MINDDRAFQVYCGIAERLSDDHENPAVQIILRNRLQQD